uniref:Pyridoxal phosphate homeostasis protein n=2 Tax=Auxenochlorella protothecoides TaxID=3075 RepID=A0A1D1ZTU3_AUXPR
MRQASISFARCPGVLCTPRPRMIAVLRRAFSSKVAARMEHDVGASIQQVLDKIQVASQGAREVTLVAVSKTKPSQAVQAAYDAGHRVFGENYVQEIVDKAPLLPKDIRWHFVGHLQRNKVRSLLGAVPNLEVVESVDGEKLADKLSAFVLEEEREPLGVMVQVNTSGEVSKFGVSPGESCIGLARHIHQQCPGLKLVGLMTIGMADYSSRPENFTCLVECRRAVAQDLGLQEADLALSMGMSGDYQAAIAMGATHVRVGSSIFGARDYSKA